ncbi:hypothetical protein AAJCM20276_35910 (plasmid) [Acetobacter aceti]|uniref:Integrase catalytic domain-containing protein n=1 Tax=Acetobacter aceti TaxID=435 RepID=A0A6S6PIL6_ACEAC|nr:hypothetical protein AAJCM20276_35910 [Acetobacter aceti]
MIRGKPKRTTVSDKSAPCLLDTLEQDIHARCPSGGSGLEYHSDRSSQYVAIRYTKRLTEVGIEPLVGSVGDGYDNALAETINGLFKAEVIHRRGPWRSFDAVEYAPLEWVDWFNNRTTAPCHYGSRPHGCLICANRSLPIPERFMKPGQGREENKHCPTQTGNVLTKTECLSDRN